MSVSDGARVEKNVWDHEPGSNGMKRRHGQRPILKEGDKGNEALLQLL